MERGKELDFGNKALVLQNDQSGTVELGATTAEQGACSTE